MKIIAIGGGEIGKSGTRVETNEIDKEIIRQTGKRNPKFLFLPTASNDNKNYYKVAQKHFGKNLGCKTDVLYLINKKISGQEIAKKILSTDIVYVGGGNTLRMLKVWRKIGVDKILIKAAKKGVILSGISAGAICWFKYGLSDSLKFYDKRKKFIKLKGLGLIKGICCPHYNHERKRKPALLKLIKKEGGTAIALENCAAFELIGKNYKIITSNKKAKVYKIFKKDGKVIEENIKALH